MKRVEWYVFSLQYQPGFVRGLNICLYLCQDSSNLDLERMLLRVVQHHADALAHAFQDFVVSRVSTGQNKVFDDDDVQLAQGGRPSCFSFPM